MKKIKLKIVFLLILTVMLLAIGISVYATNENIEMVKISDTDYAIYIKSNESTDFYFAFSNDASVDATTLTYKPNALDGANKIAYINSETIGLFANPTYMWAKTSGGDAILTAVEVNLSDSITKSNLLLTDKITKQINVDSSNTVTTETIVDNIKKTETIGTAKILDEGSFEYQIIKATTSTEYNDLNNLAKKISKFNSGTAIYTKVQTYKEFYKLYSKLSSELLISEWKIVENREIKQPVNAEDGEEYVLWIRKDSKEMDAQFLTSTKKVSEEKITETITSKLPITYDNNTLLEVLGIIIVAIIVVCVRIRVLNNKKEK